MSDEKLYKAEEAKQLQVQSNLVPMAIIGAGVVMLVANLFWAHPIDFLWPGFVILPGLLLLWPSQQSTAVRQHPLSFLAVPGAILTTVGLLLFAMNLTNHFEAWAYSWPLIPISVAAGLMYMKRFDPEHKIHENGRKFIRVMSLILIGFALFFEVIIFGSLQPWIPVALIGYGAYMLLRSRKQPVKSYQ